MVINGRTDLASELRQQRVDGTSVTELPGVRATEELISDFAVTTVEILDERGEKALGRAVGRYITMELPSRLGDAFPAAASTLAALIRRCAGELPQRIFLAALGNPDIPPDAIGGLSAEHLLVTRHLKQRAEADFAPFRSTMLCRPGVCYCAGFGAVRGWC